MSKIEGVLSVNGRYNPHDEGQHVLIKVRDSGSWKGSIEISVSHADFMKALMGRGDVKVEFELLNREVIGKQRESKRMSCQIKSSVYGYDRSRAIKYLQDNWEELFPEEAAEGYLMNDTLSSKDSIVGSPDNMEQYTINFSATRYA